MAPDFDISAGAIVGAIVGALVLFSIPILASTFTVRYIAKKFQRSPQWGWVGLLSSLAITIGFGILIGNVEALTNIEGLGSFLLIFIVHILVVWPLGTAVAMIPLWLTRKQTQV